MFKPPTSKENPSNLQPSTCSTFFGWPTVTPNMAKAPRQRLLHLDWWRSPHPSGHWLECICPADVSTSIHHQISPDLIRSHQISSDLMRSHQISWDLIRISIAKRQLSQAAPEFLRCFSLGNVPTCPNAPLLLHGIQQVPTDLQLPRFRAGRDTSSTSL